MTGAVPLGVPREPTRIPVQISTETTPGPDGTWIAVSIAVANVVFKFSVPWATCAELAELAGPTLREAAEVVRRAELGLMSGPLAGQRLIVPTVRLPQPPANGGAAQGG